MKIYKGEKKRNFALIFSSDFVLMLKQGFGSHSLKLFLHILFHFEPSSAILKNNSEASNIVSLKNKKMNELTICLALNKYIYI